MTQQDLLYLMRKPQLDDLAVNQYGDRAYGTPEATLWNDAYERARARIEKPRFGALGNMDAPEIVNEEIFSPLEEAFRPESSRDLAIRSQIAHQQELERLANERLKLAALRQNENDFDTITEEYPAVEAKPEVPAHEVGVWNPFVANRMIPAVPAVPYVPPRKVVRRIPRGAPVDFGGTNTVTFAPTPLPTAPRPTTSKVVIQNGQRFQLNPDGTVVHLGPAK